MWAVGWAGTRRAGPVRCRPCGASGGGAVRRSGPGGYGRGGGPGPPVPRDGRGGRGPGRPGPSAGRSRSRGCGSDRGSDGRDGHGCGSGRVRAEEAEFRYSAAQMAERAGRGGVLGAPGAVDEEGAAAVTAVRHGEGDRQPPQSGAGAQKGQGRPRLVGGAVDPAGQRRAVGAAAPRLPPRRRGGSQQEEPGDRAGMVLDPRGGDSETVPGRGELPGDGGVAPAVPHPAGTGRVGRGRQPPGARQERGQPPRHLGAGMRVPGDRADLAGPRPRPHEQGELDAQHHLPPCVDTGRVHQGPQGVGDRSSRGVVHGEHRGPRGARPQVRQRLAGGGGRQQRRVRGLGERAQGPLREGALRAQVREGRSAPVGRRGRRPPGTGPRGWGRAGRGPRRGRAAGTERLRRGLRRGVHACGACGSSGGGRHRRGGAGRHVRRW